MGISIISFTEKGIELSQRVAEVFESEKVEIFTKCSVAKGENTLSDVQNRRFHTRYIEENLGEWTKKQMEEKQTLLFIGACGIAVRAIAPCITDKLHDSAVLVMDESGSYIIPILSGHIGGANEFAKKIAVEMGAIPVITTATDIQNKFAVDLFAKRNGLHIENKDGIAKVSSKVLAEKEITMAIESGHQTETACLPEGIRIVPYGNSATLGDLAVQTADIVIATEATVKGKLITLRPKEYVIGIGCKRGKEEDKLNEFIQKRLEEIGISIKQIMAVASIDKKKNESGLVAWCRKQRIPFWTYTAEQLQEVCGNFSVSDFVKEQVGVDNVCERAALCACEQGGSLVSKKYAENGMTIAIAKREWRVDFDGE